MVTLSPLFDWWQETALIIVYSILIYIMVKTAWRQSWVAAISSLIGIAFITIFVTRPERLEGVSSWLSQMFGA